MSERKQKGTFQALMDSLHIGADPRQPQFVGVLLWGTDPITGGVRVGKSTLGLKLMFHLLKNWDDVFEYTAVGEDALRFWGILKEHKWVQALLVDDISILLSTSESVFSKRSKQIRRFLTAIGTKVGVLIGTLPDPKEIPEFLRKRFAYRIQVMRFPTVRMAQQGAHYDPNLRWAEWQRIKTQDDYSQEGYFRKKEGQGHFSFSPVSTEIYERYEPLRRVIVDDIVNEAYAEALKDHHAKDGGVQTECNHCGYKWTYTGRLQRPGCPSCQRRVTA